MYLLLRETLRKAVLKNKAEALLLSGGLDTAILAYLLKDNGIPFVPFCVCLEEKGEDLEYAQEVASFLGLKLISRKVKIKEALEEIPRLIGILESFDPAIPNDLTILFGLKGLKEREIGSVLTGDGADELFAGYDYMGGVKDLNAYIKRLSETLHFNSFKLGQVLKISVKAPYLDQELKSLALAIPEELKIKDGFGKWVLRKAFEGFLPERIIWQKKRPAEVGSGMGYIREVIGSMIGDKEFEEKKKGYGMNFYGKDHLFYFETYLRLFGKVPEPKEGEIPCPNCKGGKKGGHCKICGFVEEK